MVSRACSREAVTWEFAISPSTVLVFLGVVVEVLVPLFH